MMGNDRCLLRASNVILDTLPTSAKFAGSGSAASAPKLFCFRKMRYIKVPANG